MNLIRRATPPAAFFAAAILALLLSASAAPAPNPPLLLRFPSLSQTTIAFRYADDIWAVPRSGGEAQRLTSTGEVVAGPYFSPDGSQIGRASCRERVYACV
jgi:tricorn protease